MISKHISWMSQRRAYLSQLGFCARRESSRFTLGATRYVSRNRRGFISHKKSDI